LPVSRAGIGVALMPALHKGLGVVNVYISDFDTNRTIGMQWLAQASENKYLTALVAFAAAIPSSTEGGGHTSK